MVGILEVDNMLVVEDNGVRVIDDRKKLGTLLNGRWVSGGCEDNVRVEDDWKKIGNSDDWSSGVRGLER